MKQLPNMSDGTNHTNFSLREISFAFHKNVIAYSLL